MGVTMASVLTMEHYGLLGYGKALLDFGSSNLYGATPADIMSFVRRHNADPRADLETWAERLARGSTYEAGKTTNESFLGELLEAAGMHYDAVDIADGYKTTIVDLNSQKLPASMVGRYDSVINFGTSEHILNQIATFAAIHEATKPGGVMMHQVPSIGYTDHCYFTYTSRFFFDLAGFNSYDLVDMWYDIGAGGENAFTTARQYQTYFPKLKDRLDQIGKADRETRVDATAIPTMAIALVFRKVNDNGFMGAVETSTSVGTVPASVRDSYVTGGQRAPEPSAVARRDPQTGAEQPSFLAKLIAFFRRRVLGKA